MTKPNERDCEIVARIGFECVRGSIRAFDAQNIIANYRAEILQSAAERGVQNMFPNGKDTELAKSLIRKALIEAKATAEYLGHKNKIAIIKQAIAELNASEPKPTVPMILLESIAIAVIHYETNRSTPWGHDDLRRIASEYGFDVKE